MRQLLAWFLHLNESLSDYSIEKQLSIQTHTRRLRRMADQSGELNPVCTTVLGTIHFVVRSVKVLLNSRS